MWWLETKTIPKNECTKGLLPAHYLTPLTLILFFLFLYMLIPIYSWWILLPALFMARLLAFDLRYHILPDIYTLPLLIFGIAYTYFYTTNILLDHILAIFLALFSGIIFIFLNNCFKQLNTGIGGGDLKLMAALGAWLGLANISLAIALACLFTVPFAFIYKKEAIPFGPGLILALISFLLWGKNIEHLILSLIVPTS